VISIPVEFNEFGYSTTSGLSIQGLTVGLEISKVIAVGKIYDPPVVPGEQPGAGIDSRIIKAYSNYRNNLRIRSAEASGYRVDNLEGAIRYDGKGLYIEDFALHLFEGDAAGYMSLVPGEGTTTARMNLEFSSVNTSRLLKTSESGISSGDANVNGMMNAALTLRNEPNPALGEDMIEDLEGRVNLAAVGNKVFDTLMNFADPTGADPVIAKARNLNSGMGNSTRPELGLNAEHGFMDFRIAFPFFSPKIELELKRISLHSALNLKSISAKLERLKPLLKTLGYLSVEGFDYDLKPMKK
jgi:hypothetical protein